MFADSHAHLFFKDFRDDLDDVISRAKDAGIACIVNPGTDLETSRQSIELAERYDMVYACVGFHPHDAAKADPRSLEEIEILSNHPKVVAIGEIGLDYHYNFSPPEIQREIFERQIAIARRRNLPIVIHSREAEPDVLEIVGRTVSPGESRSPGVFHCFPGDLEMARKVIGWGFYISIPGPVTFAAKPNKPNTMAEVVSSIPMESILLETDSPYLAPVPLRGKRNEPSNVPIIAQKVAALKGMSVDEVGRISTRGVSRLFGVNIIHGEP